MKKILNVAIIVAMIFVWISVFVIPTSAQPFVFKSVSEKGIEVSKTVSCDYLSPIVGPWYDCNKNYRGDFKIKGWKTETCTKDVKVFISEKELRDKGYVPITENPGFNPSVYRTGPDEDSFQWFLFGMAVLLLIGYLINRYFDSKPAVVTSTDRPDPSAPTSSSMVEKANALDTILKSMKTNEMEGEVELGEGVKGKFLFKKRSKN